MNVIPLCVFKKCGKTIKNLWTELNSTKDLCIRLSDNRTLKVSFQIFPVYRCLIFLTPLYVQFLNYFIWRTIWKALKKLFQRGVSISKFSRCGRVKKISVNLPSWRRGRVAAVPQPFIKPLTPIVGSLLYATPKNFPNHPPKTPK